MCSLLDSITTRSILKESALIADRGSCASTSARRRYHYKLKQCYRASLPHYYTVTYRPTSTSSSSSGSVLFSTSISCFISLADSTLLLSLVAAVYALIIIQARDS
jgi:hypothetical protein